MKKSRFQIYLTILQLRSSSFPRCKDSAVAFTNELFGTEFSEINMNNIAENNTLLRVSTNKFFDRPNNLNYPRDFRTKL